MDAMEAEARQAHYTRMVNGECKSHVASSVYCDILSTIERMADHCCNTAKSSVTGLTSDLSDDEVTAPAAA
jgi:phosphate:Na+ symporter